MVSANACPRENFLVFGSPVIEDAEIQEVVASMKTGWLGTGPKVAQFEADFREYKGATEAIAVNSCTAALHLAMLAAGFGPGDEVITTAVTFCATVNAILHVGATPVLVDVDPTTANLDPTEIEASVTPRTKGIIPVHFAGRPCEMDVILRIARSHNLKVIEDCAHAIETEYKGQKVGTLGDFGCFSFYVTKTIITGEGGMILANNRQSVDRLRMLANHGLSQDAWRRFGDKGYKHYQVMECGFKYNMMDLQAAIGIHQLKRVEPYWRRRQAIWARYQEALYDLPLKLPAEPDPTTCHACHLYTVLVDEERAGISRDDFLDGMTAKNIGVGVHYMSIPEHPYYQKAFGWQPESYPHAMAFGRSTVSLPLSAKLTDEDVEGVILAVKGLVKGR